MKTVIVILGMLASLVVLSCSDNKTACRSESTAISTDSLLHNQTVKYNN